MRRILFMMPCLLLSISAFADEVPIKRPGGENLTDLNWYTLVVTAAVVLGIMSVFALRKLRRNEEVPSDVANKRAHQKA